jgi:hypothetical protein
MKLKIWASVILLNAINIWADAPLHLKGFHHDIPFKSACLILSSFETQRGEFIMDERHNKCGFGRNGFIAQPYILGDENGHVKLIKLSPDAVDYMFNTTNKSAPEFVKEFVKTYDWIDDNNTKMKYSRYKHKDETDGWEIVINKKKWMDIKFFAAKSN